MLVLFFNILEELLLGWIAWRLISVLSSEEALKDLFDLISNIEVSIITAPSDTQPIQVTTPAIAIKTISQ